MRSIRRRGVGAGGAFLVLAALGGCLPGGSGGPATPIRTGETVTRTASLVGTWSILTVTGQKDLAPAVKGTLCLTPQGRFELEGECIAVNAQGRSERRPVITSGFWSLKRGVLVMKPMNGRWELRATCTGEDPNHVRLVDEKGFKMSMVRFRRAVPAAHRPG